MKLLIPCSWGSKNVTAVEVVHEQQGTQPVSLDLKNKKQAFPAVLAEA